jgi:hypothetical protein
MTENRAALDGQPRAAVPTLATDASAATYLTTLFLLLETTHAALGLLFAPEGL